MEKCIYLKAWRERFSVRKILFLYLDDFVRKTCMHVTKMLEYCNFPPEVTVGSFTVVFIASTEYSMLA